LTLMSVSKLLGNVVRVVNVYDRVDVDNPHGIYVYDKDKGKWVLVETSGPPEFRKNGVYVIYFDNIRCPACRVYDIHWFPYVTLIGSSLKDVYFIIVLCEWFARRCRSEAASSTFKKYDIHASPTTVIVGVRDGNVIDKEKVEGVKTMDKLASMIEEFARKNGYTI